MTTIQKGDRILYELSSGRIRYVLVVGIAYESGCPVFDGMVLDGQEEGQVVWGYLTQVRAIEGRDMPMVVTFRANGIVVDRVKVRADTDEMAIERAIAIAVSRAMINGYAMPDVSDAVAGVDLDVLEDAT